MVPSPPTGDAGAGTLLAASPLPTILDRLRAATRLAHEAVERELDWERRVESLDGYRDLLARLYGFHAVWEPAAAALLADHAFFEPRRKAHLLAADLLCLGLRQSSIDALVLPCAPCVPMATRADALGAMYVLEGSSLGGQLIARRVSAVLGLGPQSGCSYYGAYGSAVGTMWRDFRARLLAASSPEADDAMARTALCTFEHLRTWLAAEQEPSRARGRTARPQTA